MVFLFVGLNPKLEVLRKHVEVLLHQIWFSILNFSFCPYHMYLSDVILQGVSVFGKEPPFPSTSLKTVFVISGLCFISILLICWHSIDHSYLLLVAHVFRLPKSVKAYAFLKEKGHGPRAPFLFLMLQFEKLLYLIE